jgi:hypothetical protein
MPMMTIDTTITTASSFHPIPAMSRPLVEFLRPRKVERMIDQRLHALDEFHCMGQTGVNVECRFALSG